MKTLLVGYGNSVRSDAGAGLAVAGSPSSHHLDPLLMAELSRHLYGRTMIIFVCSVRGENFNYGTTLSDSVKPRVEEAANRIADLITRKRFYA